MLHRRLRRELWGYAANETFAPNELAAEPYHDVHPAPGYAAQPDHTENLTYFPLLGAEAAIEFELPESTTMWPGSSVSGMYIGHPDSYSFSVSKVERDQVQDYAIRKGMEFTVAERWLAPILNYTPSNIAAVAAE